MFGLRFISASRLLVCPLCSSRAVSAVVRDPLDGGRERWRLRCGACEAWRAGTVGRRAARALERRLRRDRRQIARDLGRARLDEALDRDLRMLIVAPGHGADAGSGSASG